MIYLLLTSLLLCGAYAEDISSEEAEIAKHVSLPEYKEKLAELEGKMLAKLEDNDEERQKMLTERLEEITERGFKPNSMDDDFVDVNERSRLSSDFYEGDILLTQEQLAALDVIDPRNMTSRARRQAWKPSRFPSNIWGANTVIPFSFDPSYPADGIPSIRAAIKFWQDNTCVRFQEGAAGTQRIRFINGNGCYSWIGRLQQSQDVSIGQGCTYPGIVTHELGHTLGLYHTQSRHDRDRYVIINKQYIQGGQAHNFDMGPNGELDNFGVPYEYSSNMHYHPYSFTTNWNYPTLVATDKRYQFSMNNHLPTFYDVLLINKYYGCFEANCRGVTVSCQNGGVQDVKNCRQCKCPTGYAGPTCNQVDPKFRRITPTTAIKTETIAVGDSRRRSSIMIPEEAYYVIEAPAGKHLEVRVSAVDVKLQAPDCMHGGAMIWTAKDTRMSGFKFCAKEQTESYYLSEGERMFIYIWSNYADTKITFTQRYY